jgi:preprotein translocase subunit YajC
MITIIILLIIAMTFAYYMHQRLKIRREQEHERRMERFEMLMQQLKKANENSEPENK